MMRTTRVVGATRGRCNGRGATGRGCAQAWVIAVLLTACERPAGQEGAIALERMIDQPRADAFDTSAVFADGKVLQTPPRGTVPASAAGTIDRIPAASDTGAASAQSIVPARTTFEIHCAACHGLEGDGNSIVARNMEPPLPPSLLSEQVRALADTALLNRIVHGFGRMPSYASRLRPAERMAVIRYVRQLQAVQ
jgi:mono/diheme cytochrome c family protein